MNASQLFSSQVALIRASQFMLVSQSASQEPPTLPRKREKEYAGVVELCLLNTNARHVQLSSPGLTAQYSEASVMESKGRVVPRMRGVRRIFTEWRRAPHSESSSARLSSPVTTISASEIHTLVENASMRRVRASP
jgi:hypothetical protein